MCVISFGCDDRSNSFSELIFWRLMMAMKMKKHYDDIKDWFHDYMETRRIGADHPSSISHTKTDNVHQAAIGIYNNVLKEFTKRKMECPHSMNYVMQRLGIDNSKNGNLDEAMANISEKEEFFIAAVQLAKTYKELSKKHNIVPEEISKFVLFNMNYV
jgi:hypothetical protein